MEETIIKTAKSWLSDSYDQETRKEVKRLMEEDPNELTESFYRTLEFGTGGLRGIMGVGPNRMNKYTVGAATQGLANYLKKNLPGADLKVVVSHDSRNNSRYFAETTAQVMAANGIHCYLFESLRPTPELSFAVRHLHCHAGIMVTASHNPKEYNGYKVYWSDGGQIVPPHDKGIINEVNAVSSVDQICWNGNPDKIQIISHEVDDVYLDKIAGLALNPEAVRKHSDLNIVYTPLHGTGITMVPQALERFGFTNVTVLESQKEPDGDFPTVASPNPEERSAMELAMKKADEIGADLVLATDPDADRVGIAVRNNDGEMVLLNGNQTGSLLVNYVLSQWSKNQQLTGKEFVVKTIVTTELVRKIAEHFHVECFDVLTGFKYIAEKIENEPDKKFIVGGEESYGYLVGDFVRDKDAVSACCMIAEMAAFLAENGKTLFQQLQELYLQHGLFHEELLSLTKKGKSGAEEIQKMMDTFRSCPPQYINGDQVLVMKDYASRTSTDLVKGTVTPILLPTSNVLQFFTADGTKITVRPSGTEPKIKFYFGVKENLSNLSELSKTEKIAHEKIIQIRQSLDL
ncbi:MAG: phospho-sugar mutase [Bacteroidales bacterium]|nr:phospho-sugar mutase [Bacteroidales bacterium]